MAFVAPPVVPDTPIPNPSAVLKEGTDGWALLVNPDTAGSIALNHTGILVWRLVDGRRTPGEIVAAVRSRFPDAPDSVDNDVKSLLTRLTGDGFIGRELRLGGTKPMSAMTYRVNEVVSCVDEGEDGAMLYDPDKDNTVLLNAAGRVIWTLLAVPRTLDEIAGHLTAAYPGLTREQALQDAEKFIRSLAPDFLIATPDES